MQENPFTPSPLPPNLLPHPADDGYSQPNMTGGVHYNLWNNVWGTAFPQWCACPAATRRAFPLPPNSSHSAFSFPHTDGDNGLARFTLELGAPQ